MSLAAGIPLRVLTRSAGRARALGSRHAESGMPQRPRTDRRNFPAATAANEIARVVRGFFAAFGPVVEIPESKFDAFTVTYSCSHGYHALATLADAAEHAGLDRKTALLAAAHALADGITAWREGSESLDDLLEEAATPGGIAATCAAAMDAAGYRHAVRNGVAAGLRHARSASVPDLSGTDNNQLTYSSNSRQLPVG